MPESAKPCYVIDTSSLIHWFVETYPPRLLPKLPERILELAKEGRLIAPLVVRDEIRAGDDLHTWIGANPDLFFEEDEALQQEVKRLMADHHNPARPEKGIGGADPFVIATASVRGKPWLVVCNEHPGSDQNRKIPYVCKASGIECIDFQAMMTREGWTFS